MGGQAEWWDEVLFLAMVRAAAEREPVFVVAGSGEHVGPAFVAEIEKLAPIVHDENVGDACLVIPGDPSDWEVIRVALELGLADAPASSQEPA